MREHLQTLVDKLQQDVRRLQVAGVRRIDGEPKPTEGNENEIVLWFKGRSMRMSVRTGGKWYHFKPEGE